MTVKRRAFLPTQVIEAHFITTCIDCPHCDTLDYDSSHIICTHQDFKRAEWTGRSVTPDNIPDNCPLSTD